MYITDARVEKGIIYCLTDTDKVIQINFNTNTIMGVSGKPIKNCPAFGTYVKNLDYYKENGLFGFLRRYYQKYSYTTTEILNCRIIKYVDRLLNMGFNEFNIVNIITYYRAWRHSENELNSDNTYKIIAKASKSFPDFDMDVALEKYEKQQFFNEIHLSTDVLEETQKNYIYDKYTSASKIDQRYFKKYINYIVYWVAFEEFEYYNSRIWTYSQYSMFSNIYQYLKACEDLGIEPAKKNIYKHIVTTHKAYEQLKNMQLSEQVKEKQISNKVKFFFEDDNYTMIFPMSIKEFVDEGEALNNCLGWNHYADRVADNSAVVCFIRSKKNVNEPFIACDIRFHNGYYINQFLGKSNTDPFNDELIIEYYKNLTKFVHNIKD